LIALAFFLLGLPFVASTGIHYDAAYELGCSYTCDNAAYSVTLLGHRIPLMVLPYVGSLKAWLYWPILQYLEPTPYALRLPLLAVAALTVWLAFLLLERMHGRAAAVAGALLLATDGAFLIASAYDFGPVVLLHFSLLAGMLLLLRFERTRSYVCLAGAFGIFGLALWHKALFIWMLTSLAIAALILFPKRIAKLVSPRSVSVAVLSLLVGASPLIYYNLAQHGATLHPSEMMSGNAPFSQKALLLRMTLDGSVMFGWLTEDKWPETVRAPHGSLAKISSGLDKWTGHPRRTWMVYAFAASCVLLLFTQARRLGAFLLLYLAIAWGQMILLPNTGATVHHVLLLWPFPQFVVAVTSVEMARRFGKIGLTVSAAAMAVLICGNLLLINGYYAALSTQGAADIWTDAIYPLFSYLDSLDRPHIITTDWGYGTTLCLLSGGDIRMDNISYTLISPSKADSQWLRGLIEDDRALFVDHTKDGVVFHAARQHLAALALEAGRHREIVKVIADRNARPRFEIFRYAPGP
jgi:hypothetical protein